MNLQQAAREFGFAEAFLLPNVSYTDWTRHRSDGAFHSNANSVQADPKTAYPWANVCLICVWPYVPYDDDSVVAPYYVASNEAYHAMNRLLEFFSVAGIRAARAETPYRTQLLSAGIGSRMDNQLWYYPPYGTYTHLQGAMLRIEEPVEYTRPHANTPVCDHCARCEAVCYGALKNGAFDWKNCIRSYLEGDPIPDRFLPLLECLSGCQRCQNACPKNPQMRVPIPEFIQKALDPVEIVKGNDAEALKLLGKNQRRRLMRQAIVLCGNQKRIDALFPLSVLQKKTGKMFEKELAYAISLLQNEGNVIE